MKKIIKKRRTPKNDVGFRTKNKTLKDIAEDLGLTYQQIADISVGRMKKFMKGGFKYQPTIDIQKISV